MTDYVATRWYRSPELLLSYSIYGKEVDYWAIGCLMGELCDGQPLFPGDTEVDQLFLIQKMLGCLTSEQYECFARNPRFIGLKFPEIQKPETLEKRYVGILSKKALSFMSGLLKMNPGNRINGADCLKHTYFEGLSKMDENNSFCELSPIKNKKRAIHSSHGKTFIQILGVSSTHALA
jgi:cyclin-dependent kinase-like